MHDTQQEQCPYTLQLITKIREQAADDKIAKNALAQMEDFHATKGFYPVRVKTAAKAYVSTTSTDQLEIGLNPKNDYSLIEAVRLTINSITTSFDTNHDAKAVPGQDDIFTQMQTSRPDKRSVPKTARRPVSKPYRSFYS